MNHYKLIYFTMFHQPNTQKTSEIKQLVYNNLTFQRLGPERYLRHELLQHQHSRIHFLLAETYRLTWLQVYRLMGTQMHGWKR